MKCNQCGTELTTDDMKTTSCICNNCRNGKQYILSVPGPPAATVEFTNQWQLCPKCGGQGKVLFPPNMPWNPTYAGNGTPFECDVCHGKKIISATTGQPPKE